MHSSGLIPSVLRRGAVALALTAVITAAHAQATASSAEPARVRAGRVNLVLPSPSPGLVEMGPDLRVLAEVLAPATNRVIAAYIPPEELAKLPQGGGHAFDEYGLVEVLRPAEFSDVNESIFRTIVDATDKQFQGQALNDVTKRSQDAIQNRIKELGLRSDVTLEKIVPLGKMFDKPNTAGFAMMMPVSTKGSTVNMACGMMFMRVHNRLLYAYLYTRYVDQSSVERVMKSSEAWADAILKANAE